MVRRVLNLEGAAVLGAIVYIYFFRVDGSWVLFVGLLLAPDVGRYLQKVCKQSGGVPSL